MTITASECQGISGSLGLSDIPLPILVPLGGFFVFSFFMVGLKQEQWPDHFIFHSLRYRSFSASVIPRHPFANRPFQSWPGVVLCLLCGFVVFFGICS